VSSQIETKIFAIRQLDLGINGSILVHSSHFSPENLGAWKILGLIETWGL